MKFGKLSFIAFLNLYEKNEVIELKHDNTKKIITDTLREHPEGLTFTSLAEHVGLHRHTTTKYIYELMGAGKISQRHIGAAKLCYLKDMDEHSKESLQEINSEKITRPKLTEKMKKFVLIFEKIKGEFH